MNKCELIGNIVKDPELNTTNSGIAVCKFTLAVQRKFQNADGERETDFIPVVAWKKTAELCGQYLKKGNKAGIVGCLQVRSYDAQDGTKRYATEVVADEVEFLSPKSETKTEPKAKQPKPEPVYDNNDFPW